MADIDSLVISGTLYTVTDSGATKTVELTQQQYDALQVKDPNTLYIISDATPIDISTKADASAFTAHSADTVIHVTSAQTASWDAKSNFSGSYTDLTDKPTIPTVDTTLTSGRNKCSTRECYMDSVWRSQDG